MTPTSVRISGAVLLAMLIFNVPGPARALAQAPEAGRLEVVATHSILGNLVHNVAGDSVALTPLVGPDGDTHTYEPVPADTITVANADLLFENGLGFETWLNDLYNAS